MAGGVSFAYMEAVVGAREWRTAIQTGKDEGKGSANSSAIGGGGDNSWGQETTWAFEDIEGMGESDKLQNRRALIWQSWASHHFRTTSNWCRPQGQQNQQGWPIPTWLGPNTGLFVSPVFKTIQVGISRNKEVLQPLVTQWLALLDLVKAQSIQWKSRQCNRGARRSLNWTCVGGGATSAASGQNKFKKCIIIVDRKTPYNTST